MHEAKYLTILATSEKYLTTTNHKSVPVIPRFFVYFWSLLWLAGQIPTFFFYLAKERENTHFYGLMDRAHLFDQMKTWSQLWVARITRPIESRTGQSWPKKWLVVLLV